MQPQCETDISYKLPDDGCSPESQPVSILDFLLCISSTHKFQAQLHSVILCRVSRG